MSIRSAVMGLAPRSNRRIAALAMLGIVGWLFAFAVHLHVPEREPDAAPAHLHHACLMCAALQTAAGAVPDIAALPVGSTPFAESIVRMPAPRVRPQPAYRSRAPPLL